MDYPVDDMLDILDSWMREFDCEIDVDPYGGLHKIHRYVSRNGNEYQVGADQRNGHWDVYQEYHNIPRTWRAMLVSRGDAMQDAMYAMTEMWQLADNSNSTAKS